MVVNMVVSTVVNLVGSTFPRISSHMSEALQLVMKSWTSLCYEVMRNYVAKLKLQLLPQLLLISLIRKFSCNSTCNHTNYCTPQGQPHL